MTFSLIYSTSPHPCLNFSFFFFFLLTVVGFCIQNFPVNASKWQAKKARKKRRSWRGCGRDWDAERERERAQKKAAFAMRQALNFPQVKQKLSWVGAQTDRQTERQSREETDDLQPTKANHEVAPLKHASLAHCDNENDTHTHTEKDTHIHTQLQLYTREASKQFRGILQGAETLVKKSKPPQIGHGNSSATDVNVRTNTHTHTLWETHARTHMWV